MARLLQSFIPNRGKGIKKIKQKSFELTKYCSPPRYKNSEISCWSTRRTIHWEEIKNDSRKLYLWSKHSSQPCLNPEPATHQSQLQFKLPGNRKIRLKLGISLSNFSAGSSLSTLIYTLQRIATQITHSSIGCHILVLFSIGADSRKWNEYQTLFHHSPSPPIRLSPFTLSRHSLHLCNFHPSLSLANFALYTHSVSLCHALLSVAFHPLSSCYQCQKRSV